jgi:hypothetical protein
MDEANTKTSENCFHRNSLEFLDKKIALLETNLHRSIIQMRYYSCTGAVEITAWV